MKERTAGGRTTSYPARRCQFRVAVEIPRSGDRSSATNASLLAAESATCLDGDSGINGGGEQEGRAEHTAQGRGCSQLSISGFRIHIVLTGLGPPAQASGL